MALDTLHIANCFLEVVADDTFFLPVDRLAVTPDFDVEQFELSSGSIGQAIGDTRLLFDLEYGFLEPSLGSAPLGLPALVKKFMDLDQVFLGPDADQAATKFEVLFRFERFGSFIQTEKGRVSRRARIPLMTRDRLSAADLQFFNFI